MVPLSRCVHTLIYERKFYVFYQWTDIIERYLDISTIAGRRRGKIRPRLYPGTKEEDPSSKMNVYIRENSDHVSRFVLKRYFIEMKVVTYFWYLVKFRVIYNPLIFLIFNFFGETVTGMYYFSSLVTHFLRPFLKNLT